MSEEPLVKPESDLMNPLDNIDYHRVADFLEVGWEERRDPKLAEQIDKVYRWGQQQAGEDRVKALMAVKQAMKGIGFTEKGEKAIKKFYQWIRLDSRRKKIEQEQELLSEY